MPTARICRVCRKQYPDAGKADPPAVRVCSSECFAEFLRSIILLLKDEPFSLQEWDTVLFEVDEKERMANGRSTYEIRMADWLNSKGFSFEYEPYRIETSSGFYIPDFLVTDRVFIETKGLWYPYAKKKVKELWDIVGEDRLLLVDRALLSRITRRRNAR